MGQVTEEIATARDAAERNARAVMTGDLTRVMADITPEAMAKLMQMGAEAQAAGHPTPTTMPNIDSYEVVDDESDANGSTFHVTFVAPIGRATVKTRWEQLLGEWKLVDIALVSAEVKPETS